MKKNELMNGDIVVLHSGMLAVVICKDCEKYLLFQTSGFEFLDDYYDDDLIYEDGEDAVMQVYRGDWAVGFEAVDEETPIYEREKNWVRPTEEIIAAAKLQREAQAAQQGSETKNECISIIAQGFYGNRTGTEIRPDEIDRFILGYQCGSIPITKPVDRTIVHLSDAEGLVLIYNKFEEEARRKLKEEALRRDNYIMKPLAAIPEMDLEVYSRCIVCRMTVEGKFESVRNEDLEIWGRYLSL